MLELSPVAPGRTRLIFTHSGWGAGPAWDRAYAYFDAGWSLVLGRLVQRFRSGPIDWSRKADVPPLASTLRAERGAVQ
jgi:hypothetical protein